jgi:outer membrane protein TolC
MSAYLQLRGLDAQLKISNRTLTSYAKTVPLFELQYKYGQVPSAKAFWMVNS